MSLLWLKGPSGDPFQYYCADDGINIPSIAGKLQLKETSVELNGVLVGLPNGGNIPLANAAVFLNGLGGSAETAIPVTGQVAGEFPPWRGVLRLRR